MNDAGTRTRLRKGLIHKRGRQQENGVTNEELDVLLSDAPKAEVQFHKSPSQKSRRKGKRPSRA